MRDFKSLAALAGHLTHQAARGGVAIEAAMRQAGKIIEAEARREIGTYQGEVAPFAGWAELADSTKDDRARQGYSEDSPLLRSGALRDSISTTVAPSGLEVQVGSNSLVAVYQELGTRHIPPRSFLGGAMARKLPEVRALVGGAAVAALVGAGVHNQRLDIE